jgi:hypothetical protein
MSSIDGKISCDRCGEYNHERSMVFHGTTSMCVGCNDEVEELEEMYGLTKEQRLSHLDTSTPNTTVSDTTVADEDIFFACDECGTMTAEHMLAKVPTNAGTLNCCPMCYSECYEDPRGISTEYTINYLEVIKHEVKVTAMSRAQAERITLSGNKEFALRTTRLPQTIGKSIIKETNDDKP